MLPLIRLAKASDAPHWLELVRTLLGSDYPAREIYDLNWIARQLEPATGHETWVVELNGTLQASISILAPPGATSGPISNLGRNLHRPESFTNGASRALLARINEVAGQRQQMVMSRVAAFDQPQQLLYEEAGYVCVGFQPFKHLLQARIGVLYYVKPSSPILETRFPLAESMPQIWELGQAVLNRFGVNFRSLQLRDGINGYPLQTDLKVSEVDLTRFKEARSSLQASQPPVEISGGFNLGLGFMRVPSTGPVRALLGHKEKEVVAGLAFYFDEHDRCVRLIESFAVDGISTGTLFQQALSIIQSQLSPIYVEVDILGTAPKLLKTAEQLGFLPVAYMPAFVRLGESFADVIKMVKVNIGYHPESSEVSPNARAVVTVIDQNLRDLRMGVAVINLLRGLSIFSGLGDGELRKIARLFTQKLFRPGEVIFKKGDSGNEAYVVMRGQIDIRLEESSKAIASLCSGQIFGELGFLDGAPRNAFAVATQASILLMVQRSSMTDLSQREPHLGMIVMRNIALDLSNKLRQANAVIANANR